MKDYQRVVEGEGGFLTNSWREITGGRYDIEGGVGDTK